MCVCVCVCVCIACKHWQAYLLSKFFSLQLSFVWSVFWIEGYSLSRYIQSLIERIIFTWWLLSSHSLSHFCRTPEYPNILVGVAEKLRRCQMYPLQKGKTFTKKRDFVSAGSRICTNYLSCRHFQKCESCAGVWNGLVLLHINHSRLFNAKFFLCIYIKYIRFGLVGL